MRSAKLAIVRALVPALGRLVPEPSVYAVERATLPTTPVAEVICTSSERTERPLIRHDLSVEITVSSTSEDEADISLDRIVTAVRGRLSAAEAESDPIVLPDGSTALATPFQVTSTCGQLL